MQTKRKKCDVLDIEKGRYGGHVPRMGEVRN